MTKHPELLSLQNGNLPKATVICSTTPTAKPQRRKSQSHKPLGERRKAVLRQELMVFLGNAGVLGAGMAVALPAVTLPQLTNPSEEFHLSTEEASWYSSINSMACPLGGLLVGYLMDRIGRKRTILVMNITGVLGWLLLATAPYQGDRNAVYIQMLIARFLSGVMMGLSVSPVGVYSAEISLPRIRGRLILGTSIGLAAGILCMYIMGYFLREDWQLISIISTVYQVVTTIFVLPMPETPSWLLQNGHAEAARQALKYFRGLNKHDIGFCDEFESELTQIKKSAEQSRNTANNESLLQAIRTPEVYKPLLLMIGFFAFQQWSGVVIVVVFAVQISVSAGVSIDPFLCAVLVGVARIITAFFMSTIFEKWGRRPAGMVSASGMGACMLLLAVGDWWPQVNVQIPLLPVICIVLCIIFSTMGLLTLPFFMISEVYPQRVRGSASGLTVCFGLLISFIVIKVYPSLEAWMGTANVFAFFGLVSVLAVAYIFFLIPETKGRTLLEIEEYFRTGRRMSQAELALRTARTENEVELKEIFIKT